MNSSFFFQLFLVWGYYELIKAQQVCVSVCKPSFIWDKCWWAQLLGCMAVAVGFAGGKESASQHGRHRSSSVQVRSLGPEDPWRGNGYPLEYSRLENSMGKGGLQSMGLQSVGHNLPTERTHTWVHVWFLRNAKFHVLIMHFTLTPIN